MPSSPTDRGGKEAADCCHLLTVVLRNVHLLQPHSLDERVNPLGCSGGLSSKGSVAAGISRLPFNRAWTSPPAGTKSFAVLMRCGRYPDGGYYSREELAGNDGLYGSMRPAYIDAPHRYVINVIALDLEPATLQPGPDRDQLLKLITGHSLGPASMVVRYRSEQ